MSDWTFLSNHGHVLACLAQDGDARLRDVAERVGITERAVQKIVKDMQMAGVVKVSKHGRRNRYKINGRKSLRHEIESHCRVSQLVELLKSPTRRGPRSVASRPAATTGDEPSHDPRPNPEPPEPPRPQPEPDRKHPPETRPKRDQRGEAAPGERRDGDQGSLF